MDNAPDNSRPNSMSIGGFLASYWLLLAAGILFFLIHRSLFGAWWAVWNAPDSYFSHGPLVPFIAGYMVWANKKRFARINIKPCRAGYPILVVALLLFILGHWTQAGTLRAIVFIMMIFGIMLVLLGYKMTKLLTVPIAFLLTMVPMAASLLDSATANMQIKSAAVASQFLRLSGYEADLRGTTIYSYDLPSPLIVGMPCSGLRTLISLITFTVFFVYMVRAERWKKAVLLLASFPLSLFINSLRITMIGYAGIWTGSASAMHKFHDYSGYIGLAICFGLLFGIAKLLKAGEFGLPTPKVDPDAVLPSRASFIGAGLPGAFVLLVLVLAGTASLFASPIHSSAKGRLDRRSIPVSFNNWVGADLPIEKSVVDWLSSGDLLSRCYVEQSDTGRQIQVFMTAANNPDAFHDPHTCLPGSGSPISTDRIILLHFNKPRQMTVRATLIETTSSVGQGLVLYWYMIGPDSMPGTSDVWHKNRANMIANVMYLVQHPFNVGELRKEVELKQFVWYRFSTPVMVDEKADLDVLKRFVAEFVANTKGFGQ